MSNPHEKPRSGRTSGPVSNRLIGAKKLCAVQRQNRATPPHGQQQ
jgi:hypothetical protein